jgi:chromosome segregation ATPase
MMEKGSFHTSRPVPSASRDTAKAMEERIKAIPLPNQLPKGVDFSSLPVSALKSSTLESLIGQNEDLMARLSVALRKTNDLEERVASFERESQTLRARFETLKEQYLVVQEKDRLSGQRANKLQQESAEHRQKSEKLEKMYADIFVQAQAFQRRLTHLERYRARIKKTGMSRRALSHEARHLREQIQQAHERQMQVMQSYETKLTEARDQVERLRDKAAERDSLFNAKIQIENRLVFETRQAETYRHHAQEQIDRLTAETASLRAELKDVLIDREAKTQELERLRAEVPALRELSQNRLEQVESLQALWTHKERELEQLNEKNANLQKLNQSVSLTLNQQRKEIHSIKAELEQERFAADEKIKTLLREIQMLRAGPKAVEEP